jgi:hypothetical protein
MDYEEYYFVVNNAVQFGRKSLTFRRDFPAEVPLSNSKFNKNPARTTRHAK